METGRKGGSFVRITVIKLPKPLGRVLIAIMAIFAGKRAAAGDETE